MRNNIVIWTWLLGLGLLISCSKNEINTSSQEELLKGTWILKNLSGGFAGLNENYSSGTIIWTFNAQNQTLTVYNNEPASKSFVFDSGIYNYSIIEINNQKYLNIEHSEYGGIILSANSLKVDQNETSWGVGADGFVLYFEK